METFTAASHHDVLVLVIQIAILLFSARALGELAQRIGQPAVVGEILAGVILGPSLLAGLFPALGVWIVPQTAIQGHLLEVVSLIGAMFLLIITGLETDIPLIRRHLKKAVSVASGELVLTFTLGFVLAMNLPDFLLADPDRRLVFNLFVATALSISAIPVIAKVLMDLNMMRRNIGQTIMAVGMIDDTMAWVILSIVLGIASGEAVTAGSIVASGSRILIFMALSFTLGRWVLKRALAAVQDHAVSTDAVLTLVVTAAFIWGAFAQALEIEAVLGGFVVGIIFGTLPRLNTDVVHKLESIALAIFAPIFFAVAGLKVNIPSLLEPKLIAVTVVVLVVASLGKIVGAYIGGRGLGKLGHWQALAYGTALNARGAVEIIIASIGLSMGILTQDMYSIIVLMAVTTSVMAPALLRLVLKRVPPTEEEQRRLEREELAKESLVANVHRVLLPVRAREPGTSSLSTLEARLLDQLGQNLSVTLFSVTTAEGRATAQEFLERVGKEFSSFEVTRKVIVSDDPGSAILEESEKAYDLVILGASENKDASKTVFSTFIDDIVRFAPCPVMVIKSDKVAPEDWTPQRVLVPTNGSQASRNAAEVAFQLVGSQEGGHTLILNVATDLARSSATNISDDDNQRQLGRAYDMVDSLRKIGEALNVETEVDVRVGESVEAIVADVAIKNHIDLIIVGTSLHPGSDSLYLGPRVERLLENAPCPVVVVNSR